MYKDLSQLVDLTEFNTLQEELHVGIANARDMAVEGTWNKHLINNAVSSTPCSFKLLTQAYEEFLNLPEDSLVKKVGLDLYNTEFNVFGTYLKTMMQAYDCYYYFKIIEQGVINESLKNHFPLLINWINQTQNTVFSKIKNATIVICEANGISWEHKDLDMHNEFLYVRHNLQKPTYLWDDKKKSRTYINSQVAWWNTDTWQGADRVWEQSYALLIEGDFQDHIREEITND